MQGYLQSDRENLIKHFKQIPGVSANVSIDQDYYIPSSRFGDGSLRLVTVSSAIVADEYFAIPRGEASVKFSLAAFCEFYSNVEDLVNDGQRAVDALFAK